MNKDEALRMAIEAMTYHIEQTRSIASTCIAIDACKEALAQPVQKPLSDDEIDKLTMTSVVGSFNCRIFARAIEKAHGIGE